MWLEDAPLKLNSLTLFSSGMKLDLTFDAVWRFALFFAA